MSATPGATGAEIAIIGMAARLPGAPNVDTFWRNLRSGVESIRTFTDEELEASGVAPEEFRHPDYVKAAAVLEGHDLFDAGYFGFSPRDASLLDPQTRHFLECGVEALEDAGYDPDRFPGAIGVFAGAGMYTYLLHNLYSNPRLISSVGEFHVRHVGNDKDFLATRLSYHLNLRGPSVGIQTACSTSLVAVHVACGSLLSGECDLALAGAVSIGTPQLKGALHEEGGIISPDGRCRAFDASAGGTVFGSGVGLVVLKRLAEAIEDRDSIRAVIRGSAVNNDGARKVGFLAPSVEGQALVIEEAIAMAGIDPATIGYVAAHGTGTPIGDPIEVTALTQAFRKGTAKRGYCALGSVKCNIGHIDTAAGVASLIAAAEALRRREIPPSPNFKAPNPTLRLEETPFFVNDRPIEWPAGDEPRRAAVSSLGVGGTNVHVVVEEAPLAAPAASAGAERGDRPAQLLVLSARSAGALGNLSRRLAERLRDGPALELADAAFTLQTGRRIFPHRRALVARSAAEAAGILAGESPPRLLSRLDEERSRPVVFQFPGGGAQHPGMARELFDEEPRFRAEMERCLAILREREGLDLRGTLYPSLHRGSSERESPGWKEAAERIQRASIALPLLFATEYALARLWMSWGIRPEAMVGHSMGEYTAACLSGVFSLEDALSLVTHRGRLFETLPEGAMTSVPLAAEEVERSLKPGLSIAARNSPGLCVVSGPVEAVAEFERGLLEKGLEAQRIRISVAAHSSMLEPILAPFRRFLEGLRFHSPEIPFVSNLTGDWIRPEEATDPGYWVRHLRSTVRYADGLALILADREKILLEVGPGRTLTSLSRLSSSTDHRGAILQSLRHPTEEASDVDFILGALGRLWLAGAPVDWEGFHEGRPRRRIPLPAYAFDHERYWIDPGKRHAGDAPVEESTSADRLEFPAMFQQVAWRREGPPSAGKSGGDDPTRAGPWLVIEGAGPLARRALEALRRLGDRIFVVRSGESFRRLAEGSFEARPGDPEGQEELLKAIAASGGAPRRIIDLAGLDAPLLEKESERDGAAGHLYQGFEGLVALFQALARRGDGAPLHLAVATAGGQSLFGEELHSPLAALLSGPVQVIPREFPGVTASSLDVPVLPAGSWDEHRLLETLARELAGGARSGLFALRAGEIWKRTVEPAPLQSEANANAKASAAAPLSYRARGVYLITGGLGALGLALAERLARSVKARLVLAGREGLPPEDRWDGILRERSGGSLLPERIARVRALRELGAEVLVLRADVADPASLARAVETAEGRFGPIQGVFHTAGLLDDGLIALKTAEERRRVLDPKVRGARAIDRVFREKSLDFLVLYSSVSALAGIPGQADYSAANSFLDAFALWRARRARGITLSVNWGAFRGAGMAVAAAGGSGAPGFTEEPREPIDPGLDPGHPLLGRRAQSPGGGRTYRARLDTRSAWTLDEHRSRSGTPFLPGTAFLELARAAGEDLFGPGEIEIQNAFFLSPLIAREGKPVVMETTLRSSDGGAEIEVTSLDASSPDRSSAGRGGDRREHFRASIRADGERRPAAGGAGAAGMASLEALRERAGARDAMASSGLALQEQHLRFGPRWNVLREVRVWGKEGLARLELPAEYSGDLPLWRAHPALLDMATAFLLPQIKDPAPGEGLYVPLSYRSLRIRGPLTRTLWSHGRIERDLDANGTVVFSLTLMDDRGNVLAEAEEFLMKRVAIADFLAAVGESPGGGAGGERQAEGERRAGGSLSLLVERGLLPAEGLDGLERLLAEARGPQAVFSSLSVAAVDALAAAAATPAGAGPGGTLGDPGGAAGGARRAGSAPGGSLAHKPRPELGTPHVAPSGETQEAIARIWKEVLGIDGIGIHDNFFDLGGHSLLLTQILSRLRKIGRTDLSLRALFEAPTIAQLAERLAGSEAAAGESPPAAPAPDLVAVSRDAHRAKRSTLFRTGR